MNFGSAPLGPPMVSVVTAKLTLGDKELHLWDARISDFAEHEASLLALLDRNERLRADRFRFERDRLQYVVAHGFVRTVLARYVGICPQELRFESRRFGKPALVPNEAQEQPPEFNLSHSGDYAILAVSAGFSVGVDIERWDTRIDYTELAEYCFSQHERAQLAAVAPQERAAAFFAGWTLKEAYIKGTGVGVALGLDYFDVALRPRDTTRLIADRRDPTAPQRWSLSAIAADQDYCAAVAAASGVLERRRFSFVSEGSVQAHADIQE